MAQNPIEVVQKDYDRAILALEQLRRSVDNIAKGVVTFPEKELPRGFVDIAHLQETMNLTEMAIKRDLGHIEAIFRGAAIFPIKFGPYSRG